MNQSTTGRESCQDSPESEEKKREDLTTRQTQERATDGKGFGEAWNDRQNATRPAPGFLDVLTLIASMDPRDSDGRADLGVALEYLTSVTPLPDGVLSRILAHAGGLQSSPDVETCIVGARLRAMFGGGV